MNEWHPYSPRNRSTLSKHVVLVTRYDEALAKRPNDPGVHTSLANWLYSNGEYQWSLKNLRRALELDPEHLGAIMSLASLQATCPDSALRDGLSAVKLARRAYEIGVAKGAEDTEWMLRNHLTLLAAAHAEAGEWAQAVAHQQRAIQCTSTRTHLAQLESQLARYLSRQPARTVGHHAGRFAHDA